MSCKKVAQSFFFLMLTYRHRKMVKFSRILVIISQTVSKFRLEIFLRSFPLNHVPGGQVLIIPIVFRFLYFFTPHEAEALLYEHEENSFINSPPPLNCLTSASLRLICLWDIVCSLFSVFSSPSHWRYCSLLNVDVCLRMCELNVCLIIMKVSSREN